jgi:uncharacterized protein
MKPTTIDLLVLQPTPFCNLDCKYCYLPDRDSKARISSDIVRAAISKALRFNAGTPLPVVWHAGEPTAFPISLYEELFDVIESVRGKDDQIFYAIQTNATLLTADWCDFFKRRNVRVGVSIDGPQSLNDKYRVTRSGGSSFAKSIAGIKLLHEAGIPFHVITVLTKESLGMADELFDFYVSHGIERVGFNIEEIEGNNKSSTLDYGDVVAEYKAFFKTMISLNELANRKLSFREMDNGLARIRHFGEGDVDSDELRPLSIFGVDAKGLCYTYSPELMGVRAEAYGNFVIGNILEDEIEAMLRSENFRMVSREIERGVERCRAECAYFGVCGGGAPANKYFETGRFDTSETMFCRLTRQAVIDVCLEYVDIMPQLAAATAADPASAATPPAPPREPATPQGA